MKRSEGGTPSNAYQKDKSFFDNLGGAKKNSGTQEQGKPKQADAETFGGT